MPMETRGLVVEWSAPRDELTIWASTQTPHELRAFCARLLGIPEHRVRVIMRDTGGGFGQKVVAACARTCASCWPRRKVPARAEVDRGPAREPDVGRAGPPRARRRRGWRSTTTARSWPPTSTSSRTSARTRRRGRCCTAAAVGMFFPGPYRVPEGQLQRTRRCSRTPRAAPPTAGRGSSRRSPARCCSTSRRAQMGIDPVELRRRNLLRRDELPYANPNGMPYDHVAPARDVRAGARDPRLRRRSASEQAEALARGPLPRRRHLDLRRADRRRRSATYGTEGATIRIEPSGKSTSTSPAARPGNSIETTVVQLTADALGVDIDDVAHDPGRHRGDAVRRGHRRAAAAAR